MGLVRNLGITVEETEMLVQIFLGCENVVSC